MGHAQIKCAVKNVLNVCIPGEENANFGVKTAKM